MSVCICNPVNNSEVFSVGQGKIATVHPVLPFFVFWDIIGGSFVNGNF